jgi:hypothetical protein
LFLLAYRIVITLLLIIPRIVNDPQLYDRNLDYLALPKITNISKNKTAGRAFYDLHYLLKTLSYQAY